MKSSLNTLIIVLLGAFIIISGYVPPTYPFDKPEKSEKEPLRSSHAFVPETVPGTDSREKKESPRFFDRSVKGERSFLPIIQRASRRYDIDPALV